MLGAPAFAVGNRRAPQPRADAGADTEAEAVE
jgi:hypothetical protein